MPLDLQSKQTSMCASDALVLHSSSTNCLIIHGVYFTLREISNHFHPNIVRLGITGSLDLVHRPAFYRALKNPMFRKLDPFPSSGEEVGDTICVGSVGKG
jgi:hypothetical protein